MNLKVLWTISNSMSTFADLKMIKEIKDFNIDIVITDLVDKDCAGLEISGKKYIIPKGNNPDYISTVLSICKKENINVVIPQFGHELVSLSENLYLFEKEGIKVLVTENTKKLEIANNKYKLYDFFKGSSFIPKYQYVDKFNDMEDAIFSLGYPKKLVCIKPLDGEGGKGFRILTDKKFDVFIDNLEGTQISWEILKRQIDVSLGIPKILVMEYLPGKEYSVDCVCKNGHTYICIPRERIETDCGIATVTKIENNLEIIEMSKKIISQLDLSYNINLQFKYSESGQPKLIEINPRVSGSLIANYGAGVNMIEASLKLAYGIPLGMLNVNWGAKMIRYWDQLFIHGR